MSNSKLIFASVVCALACATQAQAAAPTFPSSVSLDGFCDGITSITDLGDGVFTGIHDYTVCNENGGSYTNTAMSGPTGRKMLGAATGIAAIDDSYAEFGIGLLFVMNSDNTWKDLIPGSDVILTGTWTAGYPPAEKTRAQRGTKLSFQR